MTYVVEFDYDLFHLNNYMLRRFGTIRLFFCSKTKCPMGNLYVGMAGKKSPRYQGTKS